MQVTMRDVAARARVSVKTVSRVVNGERNVSARVAKAVTAAIEELDYQPNVAARMLRTGASDTIGVLADSLSDPFFSRLVQVFEDRSLAVGFDILVASSGGDPERARTQVRRLVQRNVSGLLVAPVVSEPGDDLALPPDLPTVLIDRRGGIRTFDAVLVQDREGTREAVEHLLDHGHRRIAFVGAIARFSTVQERLAGYRDALAAAGVAYDDRLVVLDCYTTAQAYQACRSLLAGDEPPTAVFASTPMVGEGVIAGFKAEAAKDTALIVFGDFPLAAALDPAITVVDQDPVGLAHAAMDRLLDHINGHDSYRADIVLPTQLIPRGSGELPGPAGSR